MKPSGFQRIRTHVGYADVAVGLFLGPALVLGALDGAFLDAGIPAALAALVAARLSRPRFDEYRWARLPAAIVSVAVPVVAAPVGLLEVLVAALAGFGVLVWLTTVSGSPMGPGRRLAGITVPALGVVATLAVAFATPGLSAGPGFAALLVVLAVFVAAFGLWSGPAPVEAMVTDFDDPVGPPSS
jgi:hypothetical protein